MTLAGIFSNILHKKNVRIANLEQIADAFKEVNRKRINTNITADGSAVISYVAPHTGYVEEMVIAGPADTVSTTGNSITVEVLNVTQSNAVMAVFDTLTNGTELVADTGVKVRFTPAVSGGVAQTAFEAGDVLSIKVTLNGTVSGWSAASVVALNVAVTPNDKNYAI
jgi:hypothetical protein